MSEKFAQDRVDRFKYWVIGIINGIDPRMLVQMIKENDIPLLFEYDLPDYFDWVKEIIKERKEEILSQINYETVIKYSKEFRPDLKVILEHPRGRKWLERFLKMVAFIIDNVDLSPIEMKRKFIQKIKGIHRKRVAVKQEEIFMEQQMQAEMEKEEEIAQQKERTLELQRRERAEREAKVKKEMKLKPKPKHEVKEIALIKQPIKKKGLTKKTKDPLSDMYGI